MQIVLQLVNEVASHPACPPQSPPYSPEIVKVNLQSINLLCLSSLFITNVTFFYHLLTFSDNIPAFLHLVEARNAFSLQMTSFLYNKV